MTQNIYVFVRGGTVQGVRADGVDPENAPQVHVIDYDNARAEGRDDEEYEGNICGMTFDEIEKATVGIW